MSDNTNPQSKLNEPIVVAGAGLVVLSPVISPLFFSTDLIFPVDGINTFTSETLKFKASVLLDYLIELGQAQGRLSYTSTCGTLSPLLCGLPLDPTIRFNDVLRDEHINFEEFIDAVTFAIKLLPQFYGYSTSEICHTLLQRPGTLTETDDKFTLEVEKGGGDFILSFGEWPLEPILFPWMSKPLHVLWDIN